MATSDEMLNKMNEAIGVLQSAQQTVVQGAERLGNAVHKSGDESIAGKKTFTTSPLVPTPEAGDTSQKVANMAVVTPIKKIAEAAVPKSGGAMTGTLSLPRMEVRDATQNPFIDFTKHATRDFDARLYVDIDEEANPNNAAGKGTLYAWHTIPANSYSYAVATTMSVVDYAAKKAVANVSVYVDAVNGSDTADLNKGRGLSPEKPFKSLAAAEKWVMATYCSPVVVIIYLLSDITYSQSVALAMPSLIRLQIAGYASKKTITMAAPFSILTGVLAMTNLNLAASPDAALASFIHMDNRLSGSAAFLGLANLSFSGTVTNASLYMTGANCKAFLQTPITGTVTGKKYVCANGAVLDTYGGGPTAVPGSEAGQVDANSMVI